jgi:hypothetical protein
VHCETAAVWVEPSLEVCLIMPGGGRYIFFGEQMITVDVVEATSTIVLHVKVGKRSQ